MNDKYPRPHKRARVVIYHKEENKKGEIVIHGASDRVDVLTRINEGSFKSVIVQNNGFLKSVIWNLVINDIPFTKINYGAGVYRVLKEERMSDG